MIYCSYVGPDSLTRIYDLYYYPGKPTYVLAVGIRMQTATSIKSFLADYRHASPFNSYTYTMSGL